GSPRLSGQGAARRGLTPGVSLSSSARRGDDSRVAPARLLGIISQPGGLPGIVSILRRESDRWLGAEGLLSEERPSGPVARQGPTGQRRVLVKLARTSEEPGRRGVWVNRRRGSLGCAGPASGPGRPARGVRRGWIGGQCSCHQMWPWPNWPTSPLLVTP